MHHRREIDGLRTLAVLPVMGFHAGFPGFGGGFVGVDVFFVISGFLITSILASDIDGGRFSLPRFYERRARRILPALFVVMAVSAIFAWHGLLPLDLQLFAQSMVAVTVFASNILFLRQSTYFGTEAELKPLLHTWSLSVEEQYYVIYPLLLLWLMRRGRRVTLVALTLVALASLGAAQWTVRQSQPTAFYLLHTRAWELAIGALVALGWPRASTPAMTPAWREAGSLLGLLLIGYGVAAYGRTTPYPSVYTLAPTVGTALVLALSDGSTRVGRWLGSRPLVAVGLVSYGAYLWHQPLFAFARHASLAQPTATVFAGLIVLSLVLAALSYRFVERPFRDTRRFSRRQIFALALAGTLCLAAVGAVGHWRKGFPQRYDAKVHDLLRLHPDALKLRDDGGCNRDDRHADLRGCLWGDRSATPTWALFGDSAATTMVRALGDAAAREHRSVVQYTKNECPPTFDLEANVPLACDRFNAAARADMIARRLDTVVMAARWPWYAQRSGFDNGRGGIETQNPPVFHDPRAGPWEGAAGYEEALIARYVEAVRSMLDTGMTVVLVYPMPEAGWHVPDRAVKLWLRGMPFSDSDIGLQAYRARIARVAAAFDALPRHERLLRVKPEALLCDAARGTCRTVLDDATLLYYDDDHLSYAGARLLVDAAVEALRQRPAHGAPRSQPR